MISLDSIRKSIISVLTLEAIIRTIEFFLPLSSVVSGSFLGIDLAIIQQGLLVLFVATAAPNIFEKRTNLTQSISILLFSVGLISFVTANSYYIFSSFGVRFIGLVIFVFLILFLVDQLIAQSIATTFQFSLITILSGIAIRISAQLSPYTEIILAVLGMYFFVGFLWGGRSFPESDNYDLGDIYAGSIFNLTKSGFGCGLALISITSIFLYLTSANSLIVILLFILTPNFIEILVGSPLAGITAVAHILFMLYFILYWSIILRRAPFTLDYYHNGYSHEDARAAPPLPAGTMLVPTGGILLSILPHKIGPFSMFSAPPLEAFVYIIMVILSFTYSLSFFGPFRNRIHIKPLEIQFDTSDHEFSHDYRKITIAYASLIFYLTIIHQIDIIATGMLVLIGIFPIALSNKRRKIWGMLYIILLIFLSLYFVPVIESQILDRIYSSLLLARNVAFLYLCYLAVSSEKFERIISSVDLVVGKQPRRF